MHYNINYDEERKNDKKGGPGKAYRRGISLLELSDMFPNEERSVRWFEALRWPEAKRVRIPKTEPAPVAVPWELM